MIISSRWLHLLLNELDWLHAHITLDVMLMMILAMIIDNGQGETEGDSDGDGNGDRDPSNQILPCLYDVM